MFPEVTPSQGEEAVREVSASMGTTPAEEVITQDKSKMSEEGLMLRRVALGHLTKSMLVDEASRVDSVTEEGVDGAELNESAAEVLRRAKDADDDLPENIFDMDHLLEAMPLLRDDNAFFETMNSDDTIRCPFVLNKPRQERPGIEAVVRFGKATAGHPKTVHGGVTALTFDNLLGTALFVHGTGPVFTAFLKVDYKAMLPCLTTTVVEVTIDRIDGRKLFVTGRMKSLDGEILFATADALFIKPKKPQPQEEAKVEVEVDQQTAR